MNWGEYIKLKRQEVNLSQKEMAELVGFESGTAISLIEDNQRRLDVEVLEKILKVCGYKLEIKRTANINK